MNVLMMTALIWTMDQPGLSLKEANAAVEQTYLAVISEDGQVDYGKLKREGALMDNLQQYLNFAARLDLDAIQDQKQKIAILSNSYNVITLVGVTQAWPVSSVRKIGPLFGFFKRQKWDFAGSRATLDDIENQYLRPLDNRIHFIINCASGSCPVLRPVVLTAENVEQIMEENASIFLNDVLKNRFDKSNKTWHLSKIFKWFGDDWGNEQGVIAFVKKYRKDLDWDPEKVVFLDYDWSLNGPVQ